VRNLKPRKFKISPVGRNDKNTTCVIFIEFLSYTKEEKYVVPAGNGGKDMESSPPFPADMTA
jgi:hypothetical protein